jgi:hypothetical protein
MGKREVEEFCRFPIAIVISLLTTTSMLRSEFATFCFAQ